MDQKETDEMERRKLQIQEEGLKIDRQKLALEEKKGLFEQRFMNKHLPTVVTAILSVTAVIVSTIVSNTQLSVAQSNRNTQVHTYFLVGNICLPSLLAI